LGARAAAVISWCVPRHSDGYPEYTRQIYLLDYNWAANHYSPLTNYDKELYKGFPHKVSDKDITKHLVSTGPMVSGGTKIDTGRDRDPRVSILMHTARVYAAWEVVKTNTRPPWGLFADAIGIRGLANTSGFLAERKAGLNVGIWDKYKSGDHLRMGGDTAVGDRIGGLIKEDYKKLAR